MREVVLSKFFLRINIPYCMREVVLAICEEAAYWFELRLRATAGGPGCLQPLEARGCPVQRLRKVGTAHHIPTRAVPSTPRLAEGGGRCPPDRGLFRRSIRRVIRPQGAPP